jgi:putative ABC transport system ATP-binding protein
MLVTIGVDVCEALISLFEGVGPESDLFKRYGMFPRAETPAIEVIVRRARQRGPDRLNRADQIRMLAIAMDYCSARFRLGVMRGEGREERLVAARPKLRAALKGDPRIAFFDPDEYVPAFSIAQNVFFGPVRMDRRDSWGPFKARIDALMEEIDLREPILRAGLDQRVGEGGAALNAAQRRKLGLARALMKRPGALLIDGIAAGPAEEDRRLRALLRRELGPEAALVWTTGSEEAAASAGHVIRIDRAGRVREGPPEGGVETRPGSPRGGPVDGGSDEGR